jgi:hypothetical protein
MRFLITLGACFVVIVFAPTGCTLEPVSENHVEESKAIGNDIAVALGKYRAEFGQYPQSLDVLAPEYLPEIVQPTYGECKWRYFPGGDHGYQLSFDSSSNYHAVYWRNPGSNEWRVDSK